MTDDDRDPSDQNETVDLKPPSADRVARRALTLAAVVCRSAIEGDAGNADAEAFREGVLAWEIGMVSEIEQDEMDLLLTPLGRLSEHGALDWR